MAGETAGVANAATGGDCGNAGVAGSGLVLIRAWPIAGV